MPFPKEVKEKAAVACNRCCCLCHEYKGIKLEFHHIKQEADGGEDTFDNCIPLCFDCHADMGGVNPRHPKGNSFSENELRMHRDKWYAQCAVNTTTSAEKKEDKKCSPDALKVINEKISERTVVRLDGLYTMAEELVKRMPVIEVNDK